MALQKSKIKSGINKMAKNPDGIGKKKRKYK